jgi:hypothetical protein
VHKQRAQKLHCVGHFLRHVLLQLPFHKLVKLMNMSRSAALLSPMAYQGQIKIPSLFAKAAADLFVVEVTNK